MVSSAESELAQAPTPSEVEQIAARRNPVVRNLQITQAYHELSAAVAAHLGPQANWCTFATWASKQAGQTIRKEDLARALEQRLAASRRTQRAVEDVVATARPRAGVRALDTTRRDLWAALNPFASVERVSEAVARGNRKVFAEIGHLFARFIAECLNDGDSNPNTGSVARFCDSLRPGDPPDGQRLLRQAFTHYHAARFERDGSARAELILLANLEIGLHEQTRLQPEIRAAMEASSLDPEPMTRQLLRALYPNPVRSAAAFERMQSRRTRGLPSPLDLAVQHLLTVVRKQMRLFLTEHVMTLWVPPDVTLCLGDDLRTHFPQALRRITNTELRALLTQLDPTPDSVSQSGAEDWADLADRIHFIADLFRCYQTSPGLYLAPFSDEQVTALKAGRRPVGRL